jgi:hypothetical protein
MMVTGSLLPELLELLPELLLELLLELPALLPELPEALFAQAAMVVAARSAAPTALMRLVFMKLSFEYVVKQAG